MRITIQRVKKASVKVDEKIVGEIGSYTFRYRRKY